MRILVVEDESKVARLLKKGLEAEGYQVDIASDGKSGEERALQHAYDLVVLDVLLPKKNGFDVLTTLRASDFRSPILMLTARGTTEDIVDGLDRGADDYLSKPFAFDEFLARVRTLLRQRKQTMTVIKVADLQLDTISRKATRNGETIELTTREYALLEYLMRNHSRVVSRQQLSRDVWGYSFDPGTNVVDVYINHLRKKIDRGSGKKLLHTLRRKGYVLRENPVEPPSS
jgi:DNA-binding response OmpR family regulator